MDAGIETTTYLRTPAAARLLGYSPRSLEDLRRRGGGPRFYRNARGVVIYREEDLREWAEARGPFRSISDERQHAAA
jgi:hypothetical protein